MGESLKIGDQDYKTVRIGDQIWMAENLNIAHYRNGEPIRYIGKVEAGFKKEIFKKNIKIYFDRIKLGSGAWSYYNNDPNNESKYGKLYNWFAIKDLRGLASVGWHVPDYDEWMKLFEYLEDEYGSKLKYTSGWDENGNGNNKSNFAALPGGYRSGRKFYDLGRTAFFWSSQSRSSVDALAVGLKYNSKLGIHGLNNKELFFSIRLIKD